MIENDGFSGDMNYEKRENSFAPQPPKYKIWNSNPKFVPTEATPKEPRTPGMVMTDVKGQGDAKVKSYELVPSVRAVILYSSQARQLGSGMGKNFSVKCQSHDGVRPSLRIDQPLCGATTAQDVAQILATWKGLDQAKIDANIKELTNGSGKLQVCGLKLSNGGVAAMCKYARKDPVTGNAGPCKPRRFIHAYDIDRKREFTMEISGKSDMFGQKFISPYHEFVKHIRTAGPVGQDGKSSPLPYFAFSVELSPAQDGAFYYLNVSKYVRLSDEETVAMKEKAFEARESYQRAANRVSKETYEKNAKAAEAQGQNGQNPAPSQPEARSQQVIPSQSESAFHAKAKAVAEKMPVSFEDDDIPF